MAQRTAAMRAHENALREALAAFFQARDEAEAVRTQADSTAERVRRDADARIAQIRERAEQQTAGFEQEAQATVRRMMDLGEDARAVAQATGLTAAQVRTARRATASDTVRAASSARRPSR